MRRRVFQRKEQRFQEYGGQSIRVRDISGARVLEDPLIEGVVVYDERDSPER